MDITTLAAARAYTDKQRLGYIEPAVKFEWDGNRVGREKFSTNYGRMFRISDTPVDLNTLTKIEGNLSPDTGKWEVQEEESYQIAIMLNKYGENNGSAYACSVPNDFKQGATTMPKGVYVLGEEDYSTDYCSEWVSLIQFGDDVIHPIDQRLVPAMDALTLKGADGKQYKVAVDASGALAVTEVV